MSAEAEAKKQRLKYYTDRIFGEGYEPTKSEPEQVIALTIEALYTWQKCIGHLLKQDGRVYDKLVEENKIHGTPFNPEKIAVALFALQIAKGAYERSSEIVAEANDPKTDTAFDNLQRVFDKELKRLNRSQIITDSSPALTPSRRLADRIPLPQQLAGHK